MALENCPHCRGTGWKLVPRADGARGTVAVACDCGTAQRVRRVMERARIPKRYEHCDFESYVTDLADGKTWTDQNCHSLKQAKLLTQAFVRDFPGSAEKGLLLMGRSGVGKTHLAVASLKELLRRGHAGLFCDYRELLKEIQASYNPASESTEMSILEPIRTSEILVLDDLGASKPSAWVLDIIGLVLNARYNERRVTILTTNYFDEAANAAPAPKLPSGQRVIVCEDTLADRIGERMRSRLYEMCRTVEISAPDFRREVRQAGRARA
jgi:DNA replication protein DnaC